MKGGLTWTEYWSLPSRVRGILIDSIREEAEEQKLHIASAKAKRR